MNKGKKIPDRWENYLPIGCPVYGTRLLPFKVPLRENLCAHIPEHERFTPDILLQNMPTLKAVIDLTNTSRYYNPQEFISKGILYEKIEVMGRKIPSAAILNKFFDTVDRLGKMLDHDSDALIGVHCTHGLNRTGYLICKYMVLRMKIDPQEAINKFQEARGYSIERENYVSDVMAHNHKSFSTKRENYVRDAQNGYPTRRENYGRDVMPQRSYSTRRENYGRDVRPQKSHSTRREIYGRDVRPQRSHSNQRENYMRDYRFQKSRTAVDWRAELREEPISYASGRVSSNRMHRQWSTGNNQNNTRYYNN